MALHSRYTGRGEAENWFKDLKRACLADRFSCHRFLNSQVRLWLHAAAPGLPETVRRWLVEAGAELASSYPGEPLWRLLAREGRL